MKKTLCIGDIHSNYSALKQISDKYFPDEYKYIFLGDYSDYRESDDSGDYVNTILLIRSYVKNYGAVALLGNHDDKLIRWFGGNKVEEKEGFSNTLQDLKNDASEQLKEEIYKFLISLPLTYNCIVNEIEYQFAHAYYPYDIEIFARALDSTNKEWKAFRDHCIWGVPRRKNHETNKQERVFWWTEEKYLNKIPEKCFKISAHYHFLEKGKNFLILDSTPDVAVYCIEDDLIEIFSQHSLFPSLLY